MKTKDKMIDVVMKWYCNIADIRQMYLVVCARRENAGENK
jgi:hypothetical protein